MVKKDDYVEVGTKEIVVFLLFLAVLFTLSIYYNHENWCMCKNETNDVTTVSSGFTSEQNYTIDCDNRCGGPGTSLTSDEFDNVLRGTYEKTSN